MHIYRFLFLLNDAQRQTEALNRLDFYRSVKNSQVEEIFIIKAGSHLEIYFVAPDQESCRSLLRDLNKTSLLEQNDVLSDQHALRHFFTYATGREAPVPADKQRLLDIKEDYSIALDAGAIGPILTNMYRLGENMGNRLQADPVINKYRILPSEVILDMATKIAGDLANFQILFIGSHKQKINDVIQLLRPETGHKFYVYLDEFSRAYQIASELGCIPVSANQISYPLQQNTLIIAFERLAKDVFQQILTITRQSREHLYIYFDLTENTEKKKLASPPNLYLLYADQVHSLITQHTSNRREYLRSKDDEIDRAVTDFYDWLYSENRYIFQGIVSADRRMQKVFDLIRRIAPSDISVLISGETGTGKELVARAIHASSLRASGPFIAVNCSALPDTLLESELFGYERGAFTGAQTAKKGLIEIAGGGTLFLDEIGDLPPVIQVKLLRVLQEREVMHLGDTKPIKVDIRLVTATNHNLDAMTIKNEFRADLYYRVNTVQLNLPALRDRREDIPLLTKFFVERLNKSSKKHINRISEAVKEKFYTYNWPGNIRELENVIERAFAVSLGDQITFADLPKRLQEYQVPTALENTEKTASAEKTIKQIESERIRELLIDKKMTLADAARLLGIGRTTLWRKMKSYGIRRNK